jgi:orotidine-5'-phosphate decarboxylase
MGVIRKKTATRGGEGGVKYVCDVCSADITSTVSGSSAVVLTQRVQVLTSHCRSGSDALIALATSTISASSASRMANPPITTSLLHTPSE